MHYKSDNIQFDLTQKTRQNCQIKVNKIINFFTINTQFVYQSHNRMKTADLRYQILPQGKVFNQLSNKQVIITNVEQEQNHQFHRVCQKQYYHHAQLIAANLLSQILKCVKQRVFEKKSIRSKLPQYAGKFGQNYLYQIMSMHFESKQFEQPFIEDSQPYALLSDNLIPVGTNLQQKVIDSISRIQSVPQTVSSRFPRNKSVVSKADKHPKKADPKKLPQIYQYVKLKQQDLPKLQVSFDPFIQELRRQKQIQLRQKNQNSDKLQQKPRLKDVIKKDEKISYDFTGEIIKIKQNPKSNFVSNSIQGVQNNQSTTKLKQPKVDSNPINLDLNFRKGADRKALSKKTQDIEFSKIVSLTPELEILEGVKFVQGKNILQKKKKQASISELKKTISIKKFTKGEFERLKSVGDSKPQNRKGEKGSLPTILKSQTELDGQKTESRIGRSISEAKFEDGSQFSFKHKKSLMNRSHDKVSIQNEELTEILVQPVYNTQENVAVLRVPENNEQLQSKIVSLGPIDKANLNFIKTGSVGKLELPKISYRITANLINRQPTSTSLLESKTKLKGRRRQNEFQRLRKHFEDKLRI